MNSSLLPSGYLSTSGNQIVDANGTPIRIVSVGWSGADNPHDVPDGLWAHSYQSIMDAIKAEGFNTIRLPWSDAMLRAISTPSATIDYTQNPSLEGLSPSQVLQKIVAYAGQLGLKVILDHHNDEGYGSSQSNGLWFDLGPGANGTDGEGHTGTVTATQFEQDWVSLAKMFAGNSTVIGFDLDNEPSTSPTTWGGGGPTDIHAMYETVGNAVEAADPGALIIAEGPETYGANPNMPVAAPEGNLEGVASLPVVLNTPNKVVYSVHEYPPSVNPGIFDGNSSDYIKQMTTAWGYLEAKDIAPVWIGEMGSSLQTSPDQLWASTLLNYMNGKDGSQGGPTFSGNQQPVSGDWWAWGTYGDGNPDGYDEGWTGPAKPDQAAVVAQMMPVAAQTPPPSPPPQSPNDTVVKAGSGGSLIDAGGNTWTITSGDQIALNGTTDQTTRNVTELAYVNGNVWQENSQDLWREKTSPTASWSPTDGTSTSPLPATVTTDTLILQLSEDRYGDNAQFIVKMDGTQIGGPTPVTALHSSGQTEPFDYSGPWGPGAHHVEVDFINDAYGGSPSLDRNLYVNQVTYNGAAALSHTLELTNNGGVTILVR